MQLFQEMGLVALTALLSMAALFLLTKLMGAKQVSQMTMFDYVTGITIGSVAAELATDLEQPHQPLTALVVYGLAAAAISLITGKSLRARGFFNGKPLVLLDRGMLHRKNLKKARLELSEFLTYCRVKGWFDLSQLETAIMEPNGDISFLPKEQNRPATPGDLDLSPKQGRVQTPFVMDGHLMKENIRRAGKEEAWVHRSLLRQGYRSEGDVLLALWDGEEKLSVFPQKPGDGQGT